MVRNDTRGSMSNLVSVIWLDDQGVEVRVFVLFRVLELDLIVLQKILTLPEL